MASTPLRTRLTDLRRQISMVTIADSGPSLTLGELPRPFEPGDEFPPGSYAEFGSGDLQHDMWLRPNRELTDEHDILSYAISVNGHAYARRVLGRDLFEMIDELRKRSLGPRVSTARFTDLRLLLFFTQRAWRHCYQGGTMTFKRKDGTETAIQAKTGPDDGEIADLRALHRAICDAWDREWPAPGRIAVSSA